MFTQLYKLTAYLLSSGWQAYDIICLLPEPNNYCVIPLRPFGGYDEQTTKTNYQATS
jgi:hypothetical protein